MIQHDKNNTGLLKAPAQSYATTKVLSGPVIVVALGYFVDVYDLMLFSIVRVPSLTALGLAGDELFNRGVSLLNMQMGGMLLGGIFWGILGDKRGRTHIFPLGVGRGDG